MRTIKILLVDEEMLCRHFIEAINAILKEEYPNLAVEICFDFTQAHNIGDAIQCLNQGCFEMMIAETVLPKNGADEKKLTS